MQNEVKLLKEKLEIQSKTIITQRFRIDELQNDLKSLEKENRHLAYQTSVYLEEMRKMKSDETPNFQADA